MEEASKNWIIPKHIKFNKSSYKNICGDDIAETPAGFCRNRKHIGYLTVTQVKNHECIQKNCPWLIKNENHDFWKQRDINKTKKKYYQLVDKLYFEHKITKERYNKLRTISNINAISNLVISLDPKTEIKTKKGKIFIYELVDGKFIKRTQEYANNNLFCKNNNKCREFFIELSKSINDYTYKLTKRDSTKLLKFKEALYRFTRIGQRIILYGKGIHEDYLEDIKRIGASSEYK